MNRHYDTGRYLEIIDKLRTACPDITISTDIIVGFPGETETTFKESCDFAKEIGFSHIHTFKYSVRTGTKAAVMPDQIPEKVKTERSEVMRQISLENKTKYYESMQGRNQRMLIERIDSKGVARGYGENYIPITLNAKDLEKNTFITIRLDEIIRRDNEEKMAFIGESTN
jgi:threonylcarbamoyladenosine tRNA methylthiotransferase MtaB